MIGVARGCGFDPAVEPIPVAPAAHYTMGGVVTDLDGRTELPGLYAAGECACTGVHGANRLASNSLLECLVFGRRAALASLEEPDLPARLGAPPVPPPLDTVTPDIRHALWQDAGLVRDAAGLERLRAAPHLLTRLIAARRARPHGEQRSALPRRPPERGSGAGRPCRPPTRAGARARTMVVAHELDLERIALAALAEDVGGGDLTTRPRSPRTRPAPRALLLKEPGVVCGLPAAEAVFRALDPNLAFEPPAADGDRFQQPADRPHLPAARAPC